MKLLEEVFARGASNLVLDEFRRVAPEMQAFDITNVAEYLYAQTDQEVWDVKKAFPCLAPLFPRFWMEFGRPSRLLSCETGCRTNEGFPHRVGIWFECRSADEVAADENAITRNAHEQMLALEKNFAKYWSPEAEREIRERVNNGADLRFPTDPKWQGISEPARLLLSAATMFLGAREMLKPGGVERAAAAMRQSGVAWILSAATVFQVQRHGPILGPFCHQWLQIARDGSVVNHERAVDPKLGPRERETLTTMWFPALLAISFCHCKNVVVKSEETPAALRKRQVERGRNPVTFKVLEITPMQKVLRNAGTENHTGLRRALHICRGHFANYNTKGLFGKHHGRFWISQHLRGSGDVGTVLKDYKVNSPKAEVEAMTDGRP